MQLPQEQHGPVQVGRPEPRASSDLTEFLRRAIGAGASDVILSAGAAPALRIQGEIALQDRAPLTASEVRKLVYGILRDDQIARLEAELELDFSFTLDGRERFRGNAFYQRQTVGAVLRLIPDNIPDIEALNLPPVIEEFATATQGLVLVTGPAGHGKSTTQAAMIHRINKTRRAHIITVEDPVEFVHPNLHSVIEQREVGLDTKSFSEALRHVLREAPDVILVGEMRDAESIACALTAAETGHLVIATLHTNDSVQAVDRIVDPFPASQQGQVRSQLSMALLGVVSQRLIPRSDGRGRVPAVEILRNSTGVAHLIRDGKSPQIYAIMETHAREGMRTMDAALKDLYLRGMITYDEAAGRMRNPKMLDRS
ncbi:MAG TPA: type IV pilus twitching motility protein PilT [Planctomycetota bacterium]|nr:type IV pilus twitching motility protein PilT [Planctomycetota bacterium]